MRRGLVLDCMYTQKHSDNTKYNVVYTILAQLAIGGSTHALTVDSMHLSEVHVCEMKNQLAGQ